MPNKVWMAHCPAATLFCLPAFVLWEPSALKGKSCPSSLKPKGDFTFNLINGSDGTEQRSTFEGQRRFRAHTCRPTPPQSHKSVLKVLKQLQVEPEIITSVSKFMILSLNS